MAHVRLSALLLTFTLLGLTSCNDGDPIAGSAAELSFPDPITTTDSVGAMPGGLSVGFDGQARYDLPIPLPPGRAGMQPSVALRYRSSGQVGVVGRGWSLSAGSSIARCTKSFAVHGERGGVRYEDSDAVCLDGQPLVPAIAGSSGALADGEEFRTMPDSHVRVFARHEGSSDGPTSFEVWQPTGERWTYGATGDDRETLSDRPVAHRWMLSRRVDAFGNEVRYRYAGATTRADDDRHRPTLQLRQIDYTANPEQGLAATFWVRFVYETRPDVRDGYQHGYAYGDDRRLARIQVGLQDGKIWRQVHLAYANDGATGASRLTSAQDCVRAPAAAGAITDDEGLVCRPATTFEWSVGDPAAGFDFLSRSWDGWVDTHGPTRGRTRVFPMDANGDGTDDLVYTQESGHLAIRYGDPSEDDLLGTSHPETSVVETDLDFTSLPLVEELDHRVLDWDGDGRDDLFVFVHDVDQVRLTVLRSRGDGFDELDTGLRFPTVASASTLTDDDGHRHVLLPQPASVLADVTGDGLLDALVCVGDIDADRQSTWPVENVYNVIEQEPPSRMAIAAGTEDGFAEPELVVAFDDRPGTTAGYKKVPCGFSRYSFARPVLADVSGDGVVDLVQTLHHHLTTLSWDGGFPEHRWDDELDPSLDPRVEEFREPGYTHLRAVDLNGDGRRDLVGAISDLDRLLTTNYDRRPSYRVAWLSRGDGSLEPMGLVAPGTFEDDARNDFYWQIAGAPRDRRRRWTRPDIGMDINGDGRVELLARTVPRDNIMPYDLCEGPYGDSCSRFEELWHWGPFDGSLLTWNGSAFETEDFGTFSARYADSAGRTLIDGQTQSLDVNGDGALDLVSYDLPVRGRFSRERDIEPSLTIRVNRTAVRERIVAIEDGAGGRDEVDYLPMSNPAVYTPGRDCAWPRQCQVGTGVLVREVRYESGTEKPFGYRYRYWDAQRDREGHGALGFAGRVEEELHTGHVRVHHFHHASAGQPHEPWLRGRPTRVVFYIQTDAPQMDPDAASSRFLGSETTTSYDRLFDTATGNYVVVVRGTQSSHYESPYPLALEPETASLVSFPDRRTVDVDFAYATEGTLAERALPVRRTTRRVGSEDVVTVEMEYAPPTDTAWRVGRVATVVASTNEAAGCGGVTAVRHEYDPDTGELIASEQQPHDLVPPRASEDQEDEWLRTDFAFDAHGNLVRVDVADLIGRTRTTEITYDAQGLHATAIRNPLGHVHQVVTDAFLGRIHATVDPNGEVSAVQYDGFGRVRTTRGADGVEARTFYEPRAEGGFVLRTETDGGSPTTSVFDAAGRLERESTIGFDGLDPRPVQVVYARNDAGRVVGVSEPHYEGTTADRWATYEYDGVQMLRRTTSLDGRTQMRWRSLDRRGRRDALGRERHVELDLHGRVARSVDPEGHATEYAYCLSGAPSRIVDAAGHTTSIEYDALGRRTLLDDPDSGVSKFRHDVFGGVRELVDPRGWTTRSGYDALGRMVAQEDADGESYWHYDEGDHAIGRLSWQVSADGVHDRFDYDDAGRASSQTRTVDGVGMKYDFAYDGFGRLAAVHFPDAARLGRFHVDYEHDERGNLRALRDGRTGDAIWQPTDIDQYGRLRGAEFADGTETVAEFEPGSDRITELVTRRGSTRLRWQTFDYDGAGNVTYRADRIHGEKEFFGHDAQGRLTEWTSNFDGTHTQSYDALGNIVSSSDRGDYRYDSARPHAVTRAGDDVVDYDAAGNVTQWGSRSFEWNAQHMAHLIRDGSQWLRVRYGAGGDRAAESGSEGTRLVFDDYELRDGKTEAITLRVGSQPVAQLTRSKALGERLQVLHTDPLGSVDTVTEDGAVVSRTSYDPWGARRDRPWTSEPAEHVEHGYTGHEEDRAFGLVDMGARLYDPRARRTLSPDPIVADPFNSQAFNRYTYVWNNPLRYVDPTGLYCEEAQEGQPCTEHDFDEGSTVNGQPTPPTDDTGNDGADAGAETNGDVTTEQETTPAATDVTTEPQFNNHVVDDLVHQGTGALLQWMDADLARSNLMGTDQAMAHLIRGTIGSLHAATDADAGGWSRAGNALLFLVDIIPVARAVGAFGQLLRRGYAALAAPRIVTSTTLSGMRVVQRTGVTPRLLDDVRGSALPQVARLPRRLRAKLRAIKNQTAAGGNRGVTGAVSTREALQLGAAWVGPGYRQAARGRVLVSADGLRQFRLPASKSGINPLTRQPWSRTGMQVNFESRATPAGQWTSNVHLDVLR